MQVSYLYGKVGKERAKKRQQSKCSQAVCDHDVMALGVAQFNI